MYEVIRKIEEYKDGEESWDEVAGFSITTDSQIILLTIDNSSSCCERWGYFLTEDDTEKFIGAAITDLAITDTNRGTVKIVKNDYSYDYNDPNIIDVYDGDVMFVDIVTDRGILQFVAYNCHNGYYGHEAKISSLQLNHKQYL